MQSSHTIERSLSWDLRLVYDRILLLPGYSDWQAESPQGLESVELYRIIFEIFDFSKFQKFQYNFTDLQL